MTADLPGIHALGIDVGSTTSKIVGVSGLGELVWHHLEGSEPVIEAQVKRFLDLAALETGRQGGIPLVATGYGRGLVHPAARRVTEITCHARGVFREFGCGVTLVDIGGQDSKVIRITGRGEVADFAMSDKCAAGTGRFLENTASRLGVPVDQIGSYALSTSEEVSISSTCTVFAESEVISMIAHGVPLESILRGLHRSLVKRVMAMLRTVGLVPPLVLSGGVARNQAICWLLEDECGIRPALPSQPQLTGAYGAALIALEAI